MATAADLAFFERAGDGLQPLDTARSLWSEDQIHGVAISGALARAAEQAVADAGRHELRPARCTVDLFRPATTAPCRFTTTIVRAAPRLCLVDVTMLQGGEPVSRSSTLFLKPTQSPPGTVWTPMDTPAPPPADVVPPSDEPGIPWIRSSGGWNQDFGAHQNAERKRMWQRIPAVVLGEQPSRFTVLAGVADSASLVTNWGSNGVDWINTDITLAVGRLPRSREVGLEAVDHVAVDGVAAGTATLFDRDGRIGTATVTALANARRTVNLSDREFHEGDTAGV